MKSCLARQENLVIPDDWMGLIFSSPDHYGNHHNSNIVFLLKCDLVPVPVCVKKYLGEVIIAILQKKKWKQIITLHDTFELNLSEFKYKQQCHEEFYFIDITYQIFSA